MLIDLSSHQTNPIRPVFIARGLLPMREIAHAVADHFGIEYADLWRRGMQDKWARRKKLHIRGKLKTIRQIAFFLAYEPWKRSASIVGRFFGGLHSTTIVHGRDKIRRLIETNVSVARHVEEIQRRLNDRTIKAMQ